MTCQPCHFQPSYMLASHSHPIQCQGITILALGSRYNCFLMFAHLLYILSGSYSLPSSLRYSLSSGLDLLQYQDLANLALKSYCSYSFIVISSKQQNINAYLGHPIPRYLFSLDCHLLQCQDMTNLTLEGPFEYSHIVTQLE